MDNVQPYPLYYCFINSPCFLVVVFYFTVFPAHHLMALAVKQTVVVLVNFFVIFL